MQKLFGKYDLTIKALLASLLLVVPLYPKFPFIRVPGTHVSIRLEDFLLAITAAVLLIELLPRAREVFKRKIEGSMLLFLAVGMVSLLAAIFITDTASAQIGFLHWARRLEYFIPFFLAISATNKERKRIPEFVLKVSLITIFFVFVYGVGQKHFSWPVIITQNEEYAKGVALTHVHGGHLISTFAGHYDLASYLVLLMPILVSALFLVKGRVSKSIIFVSSIFGLWLLANSLSRISVASYLVGTTLALIFVNRAKVVPLVLIASLTVFGFSSSLLDRYIRVFEVARKNIGQVQVLPKNIYAQDSQDFVPQRQKSATPTPAPVNIFEDRSASIRLNVEWPRAIRALRKNPLLGTGYSSITLATDNDYLRLLGEVGILGAFSFLLIISWFGRLALKAMPFAKHFKGIDLAFVGGFTGAFVGVLLNATFIDVFEASKFAITFWLFFGVTTALIRGAINEKNI